MRFGFKYFAHQPEPRLPARLLAGSKKCRTGRISVANHWFCLRCNEALSDIRQISMRRQTSALTLLKRPKNYPDSSKSESKLLKHYGLLIFSFFGALCDDIQAAETGKNAGKKSARFGNAGENRVKVQDCISAVAPGAGEHQLL